MQVLRKRILAFLMHHLSRAPRELVHGILKRLHHWLFKLDRYSLWKLEGNEFSGGKSLPLEFTIHFGVIDDLWLRDYDLWERTNAEQEAINNVDNGCTLVSIVSNDGHLAFKGWTHLGGRIIRLTVVDGTASIPSSDIVFFQCITDPAYRNRGLYKAAITAVAQRHFADHPEGALWMNIADSNEASWRPVEQLGFRRVYHFSRVRLCGQTVRKHRMQV